MLNLAKNTFKIISDRLVSAESKGIYEIASKDHSSLGVRAVKVIKQIFDDWVTRLAGIVFILILGLVIFNITSDLPYRYPLFGVFNFSMVPLLFILGGIIFILAILRS